MLGTAKRVLYVMEQRPPLPLRSKKVPCPRPLSERYRRLARDIRKEARLVSDWAGKRTLDGMARQYNQMADTEEERQRKREKDERCDD